MGQVTGMKVTDWEESARNLLAMARQESVALGDRYIGTQHLLLAALAVTPYKQHGILRLNREEVLEGIAHCKDVQEPDALELTPGGQTPGTKLVITEAWERARNADRKVHCRDIWYGLLAADPDALFPTVIRYLGLSLDTVRKKLT